MTDQTYPRQHAAAEALLTAILEAENESLYLPVGGVPPEWPHLLKAIRDAIEDAAEHLDDREHDRGLVFELVRLQRGERERQEDRNPFATVNGVALRHRVHHSPDGFEWGYGGSGPADLARSIVAEVLQDDDPHPALYQPVKDAFLVRMPKEGGEIREHEVRQVLRAAAARLSS